MLTESLQTTAAVCFDVEIRVCLPSKKKNDNNIQRSHKIKEITCKIAICKENIKCKEIVYKT